MDDHGSFVRWQGNTQAQLGSVIGLILSLTTASLGFAAVLLPKLVGSPQCVASVFVALSLLALLASGAIGIACTINRLCDFRKTTAIARDREKWRSANEPHIDNRLHDRRAEAASLGKRTWNLFWWQIGTFAFGMLLLVAGIVSQFVPYICRSNGR